MKIIEQVDVKRLATIISENKTEEELAEFLGAHENIAVFKNVATGRFTVKSKLSEARFVIESDVPFAEAVVAVAVAVVAGGEK